MSHSHFAHYSHEAGFLRIADLRRAAAAHELAVRAENAEAEDAKTADGTHGSGAGPRSGTGTGGAPRSHIFRHRKGRSRWIRAA